MNLAKYTTAGGNITYVTLSSYNLMMWTCDGCKTDGAGRDARVAGSAPDAIEREVRAEAVAHADTCRL